MSTKPLYKESLQPQPFRENSTILHECRFDCERFFEIVRLLLLQAGSREGKELCECIRRRHLVSKAKGIRSTTVCP